MSDNYNKFMQLLASDKEMANKLNEAIEKANAEIQKTIISLASDKGIKLTQEDFDTSRELA